ncbi:MAG: MerR family transcriptional regulator [Caldilineaceae bacterium]
MTSDESPALAASPDGARWLSLKQASDFLGIHYTTLRSWADHGQLRVFRTPGGHRRFSTDDLRRFLDERTGQSNQPDAADVVAIALVNVRREIDRARPDELVWRSQFAGGDDERRRRGRQLFALAMVYVLKPAQRERTLIDGRRLGFEYGAEAAAHGINLAQTGRAVQFFRGQLIAGMRAQETGGLDADDVRIQQLIDHFLDEVLYAVLDGYEQGARSVGE